MTLKPLLTFQELRHQLRGRGRTTIYRDVARGRLPPPLKIGNRLYWIESEVEAAIVAQRANIGPSSTSEAE